MKDLVEYKRFWQDTVPHLFPKFVLPSFEQVLEYESNYDALCDFIGKLNPQGCEDIIFALKNALVNVFGATKKG